MKRWRGFLKPLHRWLGLTVGCWLGLQGMTGCLLVFLPELEEWLLPAARSEGGAPISLDQAFAIVRRRHPEWTGEWTLALPAREGRILQASYQGRDQSSGSFPFRLWLDLRTGEVLSESFWGRSFLSFVHTVHETLAFRLAGRDVGRLAKQGVGLLGLASLCLVGVGVILGWPKKGSFRDLFRLPRSGSPARRDFLFHRMIGLSACLGLGLLACTGFCLSYSHEIKDLLRRWCLIEDLPIAKPREAEAAAGRGERRPGLDEAAALARQTFPGATLLTLRTPAPGSEAYVAELRRPGDLCDPGLTLGIDAGQGRVRTLEDARTYGPWREGLALLLPIHRGSVFGLPGRLLVWVVGLTPLVLLLTGFRLWRHRRRSRIAVDQ